MKSTYLEVLRTLFWIIKSNSAHFSLLTKLKVAFYGTQTCVVRNHVAKMKKKVIHYDEEPSEFMIFSWKIQLIWNLFQESLTWHLRKLNGFRPSIHEQLIRSSNATRLHACLKLPIYWWEHPKWSHRQTLWRKTNKLTKTQVALVFLLNKNITKLWFFLNEIS